MQGYDSNWNRHYKTQMFEDESDENRAEVLEAKIINLCIDSGGSSAVENPETKNFLCPYQVPCPFRGPPVEMFLDMVRSPCLYSSFT